jgi:outer membrane protein insertion porin family
MRPTTRRMARRLAYALSAILAFGLALHSPPAKSLFRRLAQRMVASRTSGEITIDRLDYRLWRGELTATGVSWIGRSGSMRADEVRVAISLAAPPLVRLDSPEIEIALGPDAGAGGRPFALPAALFATRIEAASGSLVLRRPGAEPLFEAHGLDVEIAPAAGAAEGRMGLSSSLYRHEGREYSAGPGSVRFRLTPSELVVDDLRLEKGDSFVTATGRLSPFSPFEAEIRFSHRLDAAGIDERLEASGIVEGEGTLSLRDARVSGEGAFRSSALSYDSVGPLAIEVPWTLTENVVRASAGTFEGYGGSGRFDATLDLASDRESFGVSVDQLDPRQWVRALGSRVSGRIEGEAQGFDLGTLRAEGTLTLTAEGAGLPVAGGVRFRADSEAIDFEARRLHARSFTLSTSGRIGRALDARFSGRADDLADVAALLRSVGLDPPSVAVGGDLAFEGRVSGVPASPAIEASLSTERILLANLGEPFSLEGRVSYRDSIATLHDVRLRESGGGVLAIGGRAPLAATAGALDLRVEADNVDVSRFSSLARVSLKGALGASIRIEGPLSRPSVRGTFDVPDLVAGGSVRAGLHGELGLEGLEGEATLRLATPSMGEASLPDATLAITSNGSEASMRVSMADGRELATARLALRSSYHLEADLILQNLPLEQMRPAFPGLVEAGAQLEIEGRAHLETSLSLAGGTTRRELRYRVDTDRFLGVYRGIVLGASTAFTIEGDERSIGIQNLTLVGEDTAIGIDGVVPLSIDGGVFVHARGATRLELLTPWLPDLEPHGRANVDVTLEGALPDPWLRGELVLEEASARVREVLFDEVTATASWSDNALRLENATGSVLGGRFRLEGDLPPRLDSSAPMTLRFEADDLAPLRLASELGPELADVELAVSVAGELTGSGSSPAAWSGTGEVKSVRAKKRPFEMATDGAARWTLASGRLKLESLRLDGGQSRLVVDAEAQPFAEPLAWTAHAKGRVDHALSSLFLSELGWTFSGTTDVDVRAGGGDRPFFVEGHGAFEGARLVVRDPPVAFTGMSGLIELSGNRITLTKLTADAGGGTVDADGTITLEGASVADVDFTARARSVRLNYPEGLRSEVDGDFELRGEPADLRLTGDVTLARALLSRDINLESELLQSLSRVSAAPSPSAFASGVRLDLRVRAGEALRIDNNLARMETSVSLTVGGTLEAPELNGIASARPGGTFRFGNNVYRIETGRIQLRGYPTTPPELDITARTSVAGNDIQLTLKGPTDDLATELTSPSNPQLSRADVASLLLTGRTLDKISSEGRSIVGERMVSYLGSTLADLAQLGIGAALPFDIVTVEPALIAGEADPGARFTLGARFKSSLSLVYSIGLNNADDQIWIVDYELPHRTRAQLVRNEDNEFTFGVSQELRFDLRDRSRAKEATRVAVAAVEVGFRSGEPPPELTAAELRSRLPIREADRYDYWLAWEEAENLRRRLRESSYLEATVDLTTTPLAGDRVKLDYVVDPGPKVRFVFSGDAASRSLKKGLVELWNGRSGEAFLESDLVSLAEGKLYQERYYEARVEVTSELLSNERTVTVSIESGPRGKRVRAAIEGNEAVPDSLLLQTLPKPSSSAFHDLITSKRPRLKQLLTLQYASRGYVAASVSDPEVSFDRDSGELRVTIPVAEGARFRVAAVELDGVSSDRSSELRSRLSLRQGDPFLVTSFVKDRSTIASFYRDRGYPDVEVDADIVKRPAGTELEARFEVREGSQIRVGEVDVAGNQVTRESVIRRELTFEPGEPLSVSAVSETQRRLYELGVFQSAEIGVEGTTANSSERPVRVQVQETPDLELDYGLRASTDGFVEALGELRAPNLFGRAQHGGLRALLGRDRRIFRVGYHSPYLSRVKLDTDFFVERSFQYQPAQPIEGDPSQESFAFTDKTWTFTAQQTRSLAKELSAQWSYTFKRVVTVYDDPEFDFGALTQDRAILTGALIGDYRNNLVRPSKGSLWSVTLQAAPPKLGSDLKFVKLYGQLYTYVPVGRDVVWASGFRFGAADSYGERLAESDRFQAGGPNSVRGFAQGSLGPVDPIVMIPLGGSGLLILNQEIRFPLFWKLLGVGFWDAGNAFETVSDIRLSDLRQSVGAGLRLSVAFGILRFDWAHVVDRREDEKPWRFIFSLGHAF